MQKGKMEVTLSTKLHSGQYLACTTPFHLGMSSINHMHKMKSKKKKEKHEDRAMEKNHLKEERIASFIYDAIVTTSCMYQIEKA